MKIQEYIEKIVADGDKKEMEELSRILREVVYDLKDYDEEKYEKYKMCLYEMAYRRSIDR